MSDASESTLPEPLTCRFLGRCVNTASSAFMALSARRFKFTMSASSISRVISSRKVFVRGERAFAAFIADIDGNAEKDVDVDGIAEARAEARAEAGSDPPVEIAGCVAMTSVSADGGRAAVGGLVDDSVDGTDIGD